MARPTCVFQGYTLEGEPGSRVWVKHPPCGKPATQEIQGAGRRPWYGCGTHAPDMAKALSVGQQGDFGATVRQVRA